MKQSEIEFLFKCGAALIHHKDEYFIGGHIITQEQFMKALGDKFTVKQSGERRIYRYDK